MGSFYMGSYDKPLLRDFGTVISRVFPLPRSFAKTFRKLPINQRPWIYPYPRVLTSQDETQTIIQAKLRPKLRPRQTLHLPEKGLNFGLPSDGVGSVLMN